MRLPLKSLIALLVLVLIQLTSCSPSKELQKLQQEADIAWQQQQNEQALERYTALIERQRERQAEVPPFWYERAGLSAIIAGETSLAIDFLENARQAFAPGTPPEDVLAGLATAYREIDNLSREISNLERYLEAYPDAARAGAFRQRLFLTLVESRNLDQALDLWEQLEQPATAEEDLLDGLFRLYVMRGDDSPADSLARELLDINPEHRASLDRLGRLYFWRAENRYREETQAYERNRTQRQYNQLLQGFEILNQDFRRSLSYFLRLWDIEPDAEAAWFLSHIYDRFQDPAKASYYRQYTD